MAYDFDIAMSATLSEKVVHEMIMKTVEEQTGKKVTKIVVNYDGTKFDGYQVFFDTEPAGSQPNFKANKKEFIATPYEYLNFRANKI